MNRDYKDIILDQSLHPKTYFASSNLNLDIIWDPFTLKKESQEPSMEVAPPQTVSSPVRHVQPTDIIMVGGSAGLYKIAETRTIAGFTIQQEVSNLTPTDLRILIETITSSVLFNGTLSEINEIERALVRSRELLQRFRRNRSRRRNMLRL